MQVDKEMEEREKYRLSGECFDAGLSPEFVQEQDCIDHVLGPRKAIVCLQQLQFLEMNSTY